MLRRILNLLRRERRKEFRYVPASPELPGLWRETDGHHRQADLSVLDDAPTDALTRLCDDYWRWDSYLPEADSDQPVIRDERTHRRALELLAERGTESLPWARARLKHRAYFVREDAAWLIGQLARSRQLGRDAQAAAEDLVPLAVRRGEEDPPKEAQAACAALMALASIGGPACLKAVRIVLTSPEWDDDDNQWEAAEILEQLTGERFTSSPDRVQAAKDWLRTHPDWTP